MADDLIDIYYEISELESHLKMSKRELIVTQEKNFKLKSDVAVSKERASKAEETLKTEKKKYEAIITRLGFKMLHFENELRKEEREIEQRFLEKDQQIKMLREAIDSLQTQLKSNTLCQNCFMIKHNAMVGEHGLKPDNFTAKFPLDMDFEDLKTHEGRGRSLSLPLNLSSYQEQHKTSADFCYHHKLSPVAEELELGSLEHARRVNSAPIMEEEEEEELLGAHEKQNEVITDADINETAHQSVHKIGRAEPKRMAHECRMLNQEISHELKSVIGELIGDVKIQQEKIKILPMLEGLSTSRDSNIDMHQTTSHQETHTSSDSEKSFLLENVVNPGLCHRKEEMMEKSGEESSFVHGRQKNILPDNLLVNSSPFLKGDDAKYITRPEKLSPNSEKLITNLVNAAILAATLEVDSNETETQTARDVSLIDSDNINGKLDSDQIINKEQNISLDISVEIGNKDQSELDRENQKLDSNAECDAPHARTDEHCNHNEHHHLKDSSYQTASTGRPESAQAQSNVNFAEDLQRQELICHQTVDKPIHRKQEQDMSDNDSDALTDYDVIELE